MSDIPQSSTSVLTQALTQLSQTATKSDLSNAGMQVLVKHLAGNTLILSGTSSLLNKTVSLKNVDLSGQIQQGQPYQISYSSNRSPSLEFFSESSQKVSSFITLTEQQLQSLLKLPAKQLTSIPINLKASGSAPLPAIKATVLPASPHSDKVTPALAEAKQAGLKNVSPPPLKLSISPQLPPFEIKLPIKQLSQFSAGDKVTLTIVPKATNWQVNIAKSDHPKPSTVNVETIINKAQPNNIAASIEKITAPRPNTEQPPKVIQALSSPQQTSQLLKRVMTEHTVNKPIQFEVPIKPVIQQLSKVNSPDNQLVIEKLQTLPVSKLTLQVNNKGEPNLLVISSKPIASIPIDKSMAQALAPLRLPNQSSITAKLSTSEDHSAAVPPKVTNVENVMQQSTKKVVEPGLSAAQLVTNKMAPASQLDKSDTKRNSEPNADVTPPISPNKDQSAKLLDTVRTNPQIQSVITPSLLNNKVEQLNLVQSLLRIVQARAEPTSVPLQSIDKAIADPELFKNTGVEQTTKQLIEQGLQQVKQAIPQGREQDASQIRRLLTNPPLNLSTQQLLSTPSNNGIVGGIVTILQLSLSARLMRSQSNRSEQVIGILNSVLSTSSPKTKPSITPRSLNELAQLEQKHQLSKEVGRLLSGHQAHKLANAEQALQGQDTFFYSLPSMLGTGMKDIELLIKREENQKEAESNAADDSKTWQLTMKLSIGELGELLTKAKLRPDNLEIDFYTSNEAVKLQVMNYLPLLRRKLDTLGIEVSKSQCQLGKIPDTLKQRPYHVFQTKA